MKVGSTKLDGGGGEKSLTLGKFGAKRRTSVCFQVAGKRGKEKEVSQPRRLEYFPFPINLLILARSPLFIILLVKGFVLLQVARFRAPFSRQVSGRIPGWRGEGRGKMAVQNGRPRKGRDGRESLRVWGGRSKYTKSRLPWLPRLM